MDVKVSVIVPNFNHFNFLKQRLESVFNQKFENFEVILMDDCSIDESLNLLLGYNTHSKVSNYIYNKRK